MLLLTTGYHNTIRVVLVTAALHVSVLSSTLQQPSTIVENNIASKSYARKHHPVNHCFVPYSQLCATECVKWWVKLIATSQLIRPFMQPTVIIYWIYWWNTKCHLPSVTEIPLVLPCPLQIQVTDCSRNDSKIVLTCNEIFVTSCPFFLINWFLY